MVQYLIRIPGKIQLKQFVIGRNTGKIVKEILVALVDFPHQNHPAGPQARPVHVPGTHLHPLLDRFIIKHDSPVRILIQRTALAGPVLSAQLLITDVTAAHILKPPLKGVVEMHQPVIPVYDVYACLFTASIRTHTSTSFPHAAFH